MDYNEKLAVATISTQKRGYSDFEATILLLEDEIVFIEHEQLQKMDIFNEIVDIEIGKATPISIIKDVCSVSIKAKGKIKLCGRPSKVEVMGLEALSFKMKVIEGFSSLDDVTECYLVNN